MDFMCGNLVLWQSKWLWLWSWHETVMNLGSGIERQVWRERHGRARRTSHCLDMPQIVCPETLSQLDRESEPFIEIQRSGRGLHGSRVPVCWVWGPSETPPPQNDPQEVGNVERMGRRWRYWHSLPREFSRIFGRGWDYKSEHQYIECVEGQRPIFGGSTIRIEITAVTGKPSKYISWNAQRISRRGDWGGLKLKVCPGDIPCQWMVGGEPAYKALNKEWWAVSRDLY